jgi:hypothetical protein
MKLFLVWVDGDKGPKHQGIFAAPNEKEALRQHWQDAAENGYCQQAKELTPQDVYDLVMVEAKAIPSGVQVYEFDF